MLYFNLIILLCSILSILAETRDVTVTINPQCIDCDKPVNNSGSYISLVWVKLSGKNDDVHFMYSTIGSLSIMLFRTNSSSNLAINWTLLRTENEKLNSILFSPAPIEYAGYSIPVIYEFNDVDGSADMTKIPNNQSYWVDYETKNLVWNKFQMKSNTSGFFEGKQSNQSNGSFRFTFKYPGMDDDRDKDLPHLLLDSESTSFDFEIDSVEPTFKDSKFGVNIVLLNKYDNITLTNIKTLDDEYTPGTFDLYNIETISSGDNTKHNFLQWKSIFYFYDPRKLENSTVTKQYTLASNQSVPNGIAAAFFSQTSSSAYAFNVSFGISGNEKDGYYYIQTNYSVWSFSVGLGGAPLEKMSFVVSLVIAVGFGLPALVIVVGLFAALVRKIKNSRSYSEL